MLKICKIALNLNKLKLFSCVSASNNGYVYRRKYSSLSISNDLIVKQQIVKPLERYGQPTPHTHPHLLQERELVPGICAAEIQERRQKLMQSIQKYALDKDKSLQNHIVVIPSASKKYMSDKIPYVFRQNSDFLYFAGCMEIDTVLVMWIDSTKITKSALFMRPKDKHAELWDGARTGVENSPSFFQVDEAHAYNELKPFLSKLEKSHFMWYDSKVSEQPNVTEIINASFASKIESPTTFFHRQRLIKSKAELQLMQKTCSIASECINKTMRKTKPGDSEHHIFARVDYYCRMKNASYLAYPPVVAGGTNATTIHYINNSQIVNDGDLVLMDAGCDYGGYSSDITRTWPINGQFTQPQQIFYEIILAVQKDLFDIILHEGGRSLDSLFDTMCMKLGRYLKEVGLIGKHLIGSELARAAFAFCPHHVSHYLGMDVHDTPTISRNIQLQPGMVFTVEPGIYVGVDRKDVPEEFRGIGIRIEDDAYITSDNKLEILTHQCIKEPTLLKELILS